MDFRAQDATGTLVSTSWGLLSKSMLLAKFMFFMGRIFPLPQARLGNIWRNTWLSQLGEMGGVLLASSG